MHVKVSGSGCMPNMYMPNCWFECWTAAVCVSLFIVFVPFLTCKDFKETGIAYPTLSLQRAYEVSWAEKLWDAHRCWEHLVVRQRSESKFLWKVDVFWSPHINSYQAVSHIMHLTHVWVMHSCACVCKSCFVQLDLLSSKTTTESCVNSFA